jgi:hypothetical protein
MKRKRLSQRRKGAKDAEEYKRKMNKEKGKKKIEDSQPLTFSPLIFYLFFRSSPLREVFSHNEQ